MVSCAQRLVFTVTLESFQVDNLNPVRRIHLFIFSPEAIRVIVFTLVMRKVNAGRDRAEIYPGSPKLERGSTHRRCADTVRPCHTVTFKDQDNSKLSRSKY